MEKLEIKIEGMHCGGCATGIQMITSQIDGVQSSFVDYNDKKAVVEFAPSKTSKAVIFKAIEELGYKPS